MSLELMKLCFNNGVQAVVDYPSVSNDVASYNQLSFKAWTQRAPDWKQARQSQIL